MVKNGNLHFFTFSIFFSKLSLLSLYPSTCNRGADCLNVFLFFFLFGVPSYHTNLMFFLIHWQFWMIPERAIIKIFFCTISEIIMQSITICRARRSLENIDYYWSNLGQCFLDEMGLHFPLIYNHLSCTSFWLQERALRVIFGKKQGSGTIPCQTWENNYFLCLPFWFMKQIFHWNFTISFFKSNLYSLGD